MDFRVEDVGARGGVARGSRRTPWTVELDQLAAIMQDRDTVDVLDVYARLRPAWMQRAACRRPDVDPRWWFPRRGRSSAPARAVCDACPVAPACLRMALDDDSLVGIFAGTDEKERRAIRRNVA